MAYFCPKDCVLRILVQAPDNCANLFCGKVSMAEEELLHFLGAGSFLPGLSCQLACIPRRSGFGLVLPGQEEVCQEMLNLLITQLGHDLGSDFIRKHTCDYIMHIRIRFEGTH